MASRVPARIVRFIDAHGTKRWGALADGAAQPGPGATLPIVPHPLTGEVSTTVTEATVATLLPALPVDSPAILCVGLNYKRHAAECGMPEPKLPVIFMKNPSAITGDGKPIVVPKCAQEPCEVDYEVREAATREKAQLSAHHLTLIDLAAVRRLFCSTCAFAARRSLCAAALRPGWSSPSPGHRPWMALWRTSCYCP